MGRLAVEAKSPAAGRDPALSDRAKRLSGGGPAPAIPLGLWRTRASRRLPAQTGLASRLADGRKDLSAALHHRSEGLGSAAMKDRLDWVFAYGSNMHLGDLASWFERNGLGHARVHRAEPAVLSDYDLAFDYISPSRNGGAANVRPAAGREVPGLALEVNEVALRGLDRKEGHPKRYRRGPDRVVVRLASGEPLRVWLYEVTPEYRESEDVPPRRSYLKLLIEVAERQDFPEWYLDRLRATPTAD